MRSRSALGSLLFLIPVLVFGALGWAYFRDTTPPEMTIQPDSAYIGKNPVTIEASDAGSGVRSLTVTVTQGDKTLDVLKKKYEGAPPAVKETFTLEAARLREGPMEMTVTVLDNSIHRFLAGNKTVTAMPMTYDAKPPVLTVLSVQHNVTQGGVGCVVYTLNKDVKRSGVAVENYFFPGFKQDNGQYVSLFAFPLDLDAKRFHPKVLAEDMAGNQRSATFNVHAKPKTFRQDRINISDGFLASKMPQFESIVPDAKDPLDMFLKVNRQVRDRDVKALYAMAAQTSPRPLWDGAFLRMPNTSPMAAFGDYRSYFHNNVKIDEQRHLGVDLASFAQSPVPAANNGKVIWTGFMGIYGESVFVDHGLGVQSHYAHLSSIDVKTGDEVRKGDIVGKTGATGMAGGDHLHFSINLHGVPVNPVEWWDDHFLRDNIVGKWENPTAMAPERKPAEAGKDAPKQEKGKPEAPKRR